MFCICSLPVNFRDSSFEKIIVTININNVNTQFSFAFISYQSYGIHSKKIHISYIHFFFVGLGVMILKKKNIFWLLFMGTWFNIVGFYLYNLVCIFFFLNFYMLYRILLCVDLLSSFFH